MSLLDCFLIFNMKKHENSDLKQIKLVITLPIHSSQKTIKSKIRRIL